MRRREVTRDDLVCAAEQLIEQGKYPSNERIGAIVGRTSGVVSVAMRKHGLCYHHLSKLAMSQAGNAKRCAARFQESGEPMNPGDLVVNTHMVRQARDKQNRKPAIITGAFTMHDAPGTFRGFHTPATVSPGPETPADVTRRMLREARKGTGWKWLSRVNGLGHYTPVPVPVSNKQRQGRLMVATGKAVLRDRRTG